MYEETGKALRHYSNCLIKARTLALVQGFAIIGASGILLNKQFPGYYFILLGLFGLLMSFALWRLQNVYLKHFDGFLNSAMSLEPRQGPWTLYNSLRSSWYSKWWKRCLKIHFPFFLIMAACLALIVLGVFFRPEDPVGLLNLASFKISL